MKLYVFIIIAGLLLTGVGPGVREYYYKEHLVAKLKYDQALKLMEEKKYNEAVVLFRHYLDYYGDLYYGDEALFFMGKCFENLKQWADAASAYDLMVKRYTPPFFPLSLIIRRPPSPLVPEALYRAGRCFEKMKLHKEAVKRYFRIIKHHFRTDFAKKAQERIKAIAKELEDSKWAEKMEKKMEKLVKKMEKK
jgi:TolA-binding protein